MAEKIKAVLFPLVFFGHAIAFLWLVELCLYAYYPALVYILPSLWVLMLLGNNYALRVLVALDQGWQVVASPILNLFNPTHKFGNPDETASSVVGKNLRGTDALEWRIIEFVLRWLFEAGKPHAIKSIEDDE